jgi:sulfur carrier protein
MIEIIVNGERRSVPEPTTVAALLSELALGDKRVAVERNGEIVPRSQHDDRRLAHGDRIEIVHAIGGG